MSSIVRLNFFFISFIIVAFGQPAWSSFLGLITACIGYALFWRALLELPETKTRFLVSFVWFSAVQFLQLSWFIQHPYYYILAAYSFFSLAIGLQFALFSLLITKKRLQRISSLFFLAATWTFFEWSRLYFMSGYTWNPAGLAFTTSYYPMQLASIVGVYGLSFLVILTNLFALRASLSP